MLVFPFSQPPMTCLKSSACTWTRITESSFGKECELSVDLSSVAAKSITFESSYESCKGKEGLFVNVVV